MNRSPFAVFSLLIAIVLSACTSSERHERVIWYVATTGNDSNSCTEPASACSTLVEAMNRADADDMIIIAAGTYNEVGPRSGEDYYIFPVEFNLWIEGAGRDATIIDLGNLYAGFYIRGEGRLLLKNLTVRNARGNSPGGCMYLIDETTAEIQNVTFLHCLYMGIGTGREANANLTDVIIRDSLPRSPFGGGVGVENGGTMIISGGEFSQNAFAGLSNDGNLQATGATIQSNQGNGLNLHGGSTLLENVHITNNGLDSSYRAGVLIVSGEVSISNSEITGNHQVGVLMRGEGGGNLRMENTLVGNHQGSGLSIEEGSATLNNVTVSNNGSLYRGTSGSAGGIQNRGTLIILNSQITGNLNGGISNEAGGRLGIIESTFTDNLGGLPAITNSGDASIQNTLVANNTILLVTSNAAVENRGSMSLSNSTISGNIGFGISAIDGHLSLNFDTIAENTEGGLAAYRGGGVVSRVSNTLIAKNLGRGNCVHIGFGYPSLPLAGTNIETTPFVVTDTCGFPEVYSPDEILLDVLADNGGPTFTHALLPGSPARDAATGSCIEVDQRLISRPIGPACDVGAYEAGGVATSLDFPTPELPMLTLTKDFPCYTGPSPAYDTLSTLKAGTQMQIVGYSFAGGWLVANHPTLQGRFCWIDQDFANFDVPVDDLRLIAVPPKPSATPAPTNEQRQPTVCVTVGKNTICH